MGIPYLKLDANESYDRLNKLVVQGNKDRDRIVADYAQYRDKRETVPTEKISSWSQIALGWANSTFKDLQDVFVSESELYEFRDAAPPFGATAQNVRYVSITSTMKARIDKLIEFRNTIRDRFEVNLEIVGGHKITQIGSDNQANLGD